MAIRMRSAARVSGRAIQGLAMVAVAFLSIPALVGVGQNLQSGQIPAEPPTPRRDPTRELAMKITGSFTLASVGDIMIRRPASMMDDPGFQSAIKIVRDAD